MNSRSLGGDPVVLDFAHDTVVYTHDPDGDTSFFLTNIPVARILDGTAESGQILHIDLLWMPKAGATPMDPTATNSSVRHVVVADGEVGVYGGAGFALPAGKLGRARATIELRDTSVRLLDATDGFTDPLTPARITGTFTADLDPRTARRLHRAMSQFVTNALGRSVFVRADGGSNVVPAGALPNPEG